MTEHDIGTLVGEWAAADAEARAAYARKKEWEFEIQRYMRDNYPDDWRMLQSGEKPTFTADGVTLSTTRSYDTDRLRAELGEEYPEIIKSVTTEKVDGTFMRKLWADKGIAKRITESGALIPGNINVKIKS